MNKKVFYVTPCINEVELDLEGVLCASDKNGQIDQLNNKYDWSEELDWD